MDRRRLGLIFAGSGALLAVGGLFANSFEAGGSGALDLRQGAALVLGIALMSEGAVALGIPSSLLRRLRELPPIERAGLLSVATLALFVHLFHLETATWQPDEIVYRWAGRDYLRGDFHFNLEHPFVGKYALGAGSLLLDGMTDFGVRVPAAFAGLLTGVLLFLFAHRVAGLRAALVAAALWTLVAHPAAGTPIKLERFGLLDVFMGLSMSGALYAGWRWIESRDWGWAIAAGALAGLAAGSKAPGVLVLVPVVISGLFALHPSRRSAAQAAAVIAACGVTALATYLPTIADAPHHIRYMFEFQSGRGGHPVEVRGELYSEPPWWANSWFQWRYLGAPLTLSLAGLSLLAAGLVRRRLFVYLQLAVLAPFVYLSFFSSFALTHYYYAWLPPLTLLAALALNALYARSGWPRRVGALVSLVLALVAARTVIDVARLEPSDYPVAASLLREAGLTHGSVVIVGHAGVLRAYLPGARTAKAPRGEVDAIVSDQGAVRRARLPGGGFLGDPDAVARYLRRHHEDFELRKVDRLDVYLRKTSIRGSSGEPERAYP
jgi:4-amino-4-deoxy-L-arabinose transferase-like glycosyltransferase